jgi:hypothetical protein
MIFYVRALILLLAIICVDGNLFMYKLVESCIFCVTLSSSNIDMTFVDFDENEERLQQNGSRQHLKLFL